MVTASGWKFELETVNSSYAFWNILVVWAGAVQDVILRAPGRKCSLDSRRLRQRGIRRIVAAVCLEYGFGFRRKHIGRCSMLLPFVGKM